MVFITAESIKYRPDQCPSCMYFYASINRCREFKRGGMQAMFEGETSDPCPKYRVADFDGIVKVVNEEHKTAVFSLGELDVVFGGIPVFDVPSDVIRERLRSSIGGPPVSFSVRNGEVVEVKQKDAGKPEEDIQGNQDMTKKCAHCGSGFYEPKTTMDKVDFGAMQKVRVGCSKCGTAVCFSCAATAADQRGKGGNCFCPKCGAELGSTGEAGELGKHFSGWN